MPFADLAIVDHASGVSAEELRKFSYALDEQLLRDVAPIWGRYVVPWVSGVNVSIGPRVWALHLWKNTLNASHGGAYGVHETLGLDHVPVGHVFLDPIRAANESWTQIASHEALEMVADEWVNLEVARERNGGRVELWPREICDAVQGLYYSVRGVRMSNFVYPEWFIDGSDGPYDHLRALTKPFEIHATGYAAIRRITGGKITPRNVYGAAYPPWRKKQRAFSRKVRRVAVTSRA